jgi:hypothetical protein
MELTKLAEAIHKLGRPKHGFSLLIYGPPKVGKTRLAATIAKVPQINRVYLIDIENGHETVVTMLKLGLFTEEEAKKIDIINCQDTPDRPIGGETVLKLLTIGKPQLVCHEHGRVSCGTKECQALGANGSTAFNINDLGHNDVVIIDSGTALTNSILNYHLRGKDRDYKPGWDEFGPLARDLSNILTIVQACKTNFIVVTHTLVIDKPVTLIDKNGKTIQTTIEETYPLIGTKNFSLNSAKYFSHVAYLQMESGQHKGGSATNYRYKTITGSRGGWQLEKSPKLNLALIFDELYKVNPTEEDSETTTSNGSTAK